MPTQHTYLTGKGALSTKEAAAYLGVSERTLIRWRVNRTGPAWTYAGRQVRYRPEDLDAYLESKRTIPVREGTVNA